MAGHERRLIRGEIHDGGCNVFGSANARRQVMAQHHRRRRPDAAKLFSVAGVTMKPGEIALQRMPSLPYCVATYFVSATMPAFETPYALCESIPACAAPEAVLMIDATAARAQMRNRVLATEHRAAQVDAHDGVPHRRRPSVRPAHRACSTVAYRPRCCAGCPGRRTAVRRTRSSAAPALRCRCRQRAPRFRRCRVRALRLLALRL